MAHSTTTSTTRGDLPNLFTMHFGWEHGSRVQTHLPHLLRHFQTVGHTDVRTLAETFPGVQLSAALHALEAAGFIVRMADDSLMSRELYWLLHSEARSGWQCQRHPSDTGVWQSMPGWLRATVLVLTALAVVLLAQGTALAQQGRGRDVGDVLRDTQSAPEAPTAPRRVRRTRITRLPVRQVRADRWYGCGKNRWGLWECNLRIETLMAGKHPKCRCIAQRSRGRAKVRCTCTQ